MKLYQLYIDELGIDNPLAKQSNIYVLCGCSVESQTSKKIKTRADQIKFKYWGKTNVIFHSRDIGKNSGDFSIFKGKPDLKKEFLQDLYNWLKDYPFITYICLVDHQKAAKKGWNRIKVVQETSRHLFYHFVASLLGMGNAKWKISVESATAEKDQYYLREFSYFLSPGLKELAVDYEHIQSILTSISFVTKKNHDIEEQIADLLACAAKCKYLRQTKRQTFKVGTYEDRLIRILDKKIFQQPSRARRKKMKFYEQIEPFCVLPSK